MLCFFAVASPSLDGVVGMGCLGSSAWCVGVSMAVVLGVIGLLSAGTEFKSGKAASTFLVGSLFSACEPPATALYYWGAWQIEVVWDSPHRLQGRLHVSIK